MKYVNRAVLCLGVLVIGLLPSLALANAQLTGFTVEPSGPTTPTAPGCSPAPQSWAALTNTIGSDQTGLPLLLTDGRVMMQDYSIASEWWALSPDMNGCYADGTWSPLHGMPSGYAPLYFASAVLPDGRVIVVGGEYNQGSKVETDLGAIYDPVSDQWTSVPPPSSWSQIGDNAGVVLPNGTFMVSDAAFTYPLQVGLLNPLTTPPSWTTVVTTGKQEGDNEDGWTLLPNGNVLNMDVLYVNSQQVSDIYNPATNAWTSVVIPVLLSDQNCQEAGPAILRPDGTVFALGATGNTATFHTATSTWSAGPAIPGGLVESDGPAAVLPNGNVLFDAAPPAAAPTCYGSGLNFYEYNGTGFQSVANPPGISLMMTQGTQMLVLPTGQIFLSAGHPQNFIYTGSGTYSSSWRPSITSVPTTVVRGHANYSIQGKQLNGMTQGSNFGDDFQNATNYPLARITNLNTGHIRYLRTHSFSSMGVATGSKIVSAQFDVPINIEIGASLFEAVANGIPSPGINVNVECAADGIFCDGFELVTW